MNDNKFKKQIIDKLKESSNVLVALSASPSVDELSAALGLTLAINKLNKHATAIFSGDIPAAIEFLEPEKTFENNVSSLQDFIIALDKEKADHLRYKVEGDLVKIFITPYRTTIDQNDLEFSQGDYNVDFVLAVGVKSADDLDAALASHGQILEDATVASIGMDDSSSLGSISWNDKNASSHCELATALIKDLGNKDLIDEQIATALLTGIVASTERFSNAKTSSRVMTMAAELMAAGANQQLIAVQLQQPEEEPAPAEQADSTAEPDEPADDAKDEKPAKAEKRDGAGELSISHDYRGTVDEVAEQVAENRQTQAAMAAKEELEQMDGPQIGDAKAVDFEEAPLRGAVSRDKWKGPDEPSLGGTLNATTEEAAEQKRRDEATDQNHTILSHDHENGHYLGGQPTYQTAANASMDPAAAEPEVRDIFDDSPQGVPAPQAPEPSVSTLPPLTPSAPAPALPPFSPLAPSSPTLAEIDAQNRGHDAALSDVHAAFSGQPAQVNPAAGGGLPALPPVPLPPMPDFSTLPPLPTPATAAQPNLSTIPPVNNGVPLGATLPPAPAPSAGKSDPGQFKIPGQN